MSQVELDHGVSSGVRLKALGTGLVPLYEEHESRLERNIGLGTWSEMHETEKAFIIAARRIRIAIANLQSEADIKKHEKETKKRR